LEQPSQSLEIILFLSPLIQIYIHQVTYICDLNNIYSQYSYSQAVAPKPRGTFKKQELQNNPMQPNKLKANGIFLDLDGTLVDSKAAYIEAAKISFHTLGKDAPSAQIMLEIPRRIEQRQSINDLIGDGAEQFMPIYLKAFYAATERHTKLLPNVALTLEGLAEKAKLTLITMRHVPNQVIQKELEYLGISQYFHLIVTALGTSKPKPSPEALIWCVKTLDLKMCECVIVGDSVNDMRAGKAAGSCTVAVLSGIYAREELAKEQPDLMLSDITLLPEYIE
jgi:HAD superfamily hydrolase (TIGR01509 family)